MSPSGARQKQITAYVWWLMSCKLPPIESFFKKKKKKILKNVLITVGISLGMFVCGCVAAWELWKALLHFGKKQQLLV